MMAYLLYMIVDDVQCFIPASGTAKSADFIYFGLLM